MLFLVNLIVGFFLSHGEFANASCFRRYLNAVQAASLTF